MNALAPPFPLNPSVGQRYGGWMWNGQIWVCAPTTGIQVITTVFTVSGPYMPSPGLVSVTTEGIGGGGAGGPAGPTTSALVIAGGGGGGSGGRSIKTLPASLVLGGVQVTIGAGGAVSDTANTPGGNGQATTFGALCIANGGMGGGFGNAASASGPGGAGGTPGVGDVTFPGACGLPGPSMWLSAAQGGFDAAGGYGGQIAGGNQVSYQSPGGFVGGANGLPNTGAGGQGGCVNQDTGAGTIESGAGGSGILWVTEYCWQVGDEGDCANPPLNVNARVAVTHVPWPGPGPCPPGWGHGPYIGYEGE